MNKAPFHLIFNFLETPVRYSHNSDLLKLRGGLVTTDSPLLILARTDLAIQ
jgi:hypothetical protein